MTRKRIAATPRELGPASCTPGEFRDWPRTETKIKKNRRRRKMETKVAEIMDAFAVGVQGFTMDLLVQFTQALAVGDYSFVNATHKLLKIVLA
jgi:hypothetical protein